MADNKRIAVTQKEKAAMLGLRRKVTCFAINSLLLKPRCNARWCEGWRLALALSNPAQDSNAVCDGPVPERKNDSQFFESFVVKVGSNIAVTFAVPMSCPTVR